MAVTDLILGKVVETRRVEDGRLELREYRLGGRTCRNIHFITPWYETAFTVYPGTLSKSEARRWMGEINDRKQLWDYGHEYDASLSQDEIDRSLKENTLFKIWSSVKNNLPFYSRPAFV